MSVVPAVGDIQGSRASLIPAVITLFCELATVKSLSLSEAAPVRVTARFPP